MYRIRTVQMRRKHGDNHLSTARPRGSAAGSELEFDYPVCRMRLASDSEMDLDLDLISQWSFPQ